MSEWSFIVAAYAVTWCGLGLYAGYLGFRERGLRGAPLDFEPED